MNETPTQETSRQAMTRETASSYDAVPYESHAFRHSHPDGLAVMASLSGMQPAPVTKCRVLELGCASGGNLIPLAAQFPNSTFTGVDLSGVEIAEGNALIGELKLANIRLLHQSILEVEKGEYDYIISHGVYSWITDEVKDRLLAICGGQLAPHGVAYVSYNTYPGWHFRGMIRDMMIYHTKHLTDPKQKVAQARALLDFLAQFAPAESAYGKMLRDEANLVRQHKDYYLLHDHLEESNHPLYFHEFVERADRHGLQYLGEASISMMMTSNFPPQVTETLKQVAHDIVRTEQYMDFLRHRTFRQTLLCRKGVPLKRALGPEDVTRFLIGSPARLVAAQGAGAQGGAQPEQFVTPAGAFLTPGNPVTKAAFHVLAEAWPQSVAFDALLADAVQRGGLPRGEANDASYRSLLGADLLTALVADIVELRLARLDFVTSASEKPRASALARLQAAKGHPITNQRHETAALNEINRRLLQFLDGKHDRAALLDELLALLANGTLNVALPDGMPITDDVAVRAALTGSIYTGLNQLARSALLVA